MKVAIVSPVFPYPKRGVYIGIERQVLEFSRALIRKGIKVKVFTTFWNGGREHETFKEIEIYRVPDSSIKFGKIGRLFDFHYYTWGKNLLKLDNLFEADILHSLAPLSSAKDIKKKSPLISHFQHYESVDKPIHLLYKPFHHRIEKIAYLNSDFVIAPSEFSKKILCKAFKLVEDKVRVIPHGVDIARFSIKEKKSEGIRLLFVGGLEERKGVRYLIEALASVISTYGTIELILVGSGAQEVELRELVKKMNLEKSIKFAGYVDGWSDKIVEYYHSADIFVFPSLTEGFGMALVEAMACGLPVIATNTTAIPEVVGDAGILVKPRSPEALADAINRLVGDKKLRRDLGRKGRRRVEEKFTWDKVAIKAIELYEEIVKCESNS
jgi:glycosyltransferase involved in cell wall biosynthesis